MKILHPSVILRGLEQRARKRFGQHFLTDVGVVEKMVRRAGIQPGDRVLEIGPGLGILTRVLLAAGADLTCVELDRDLAAYLEEALPQVRLIQGDAMRQDWEALLVERPVKVVANLPYNVGTHMVMQLLRSPHLFQSIHVMLQKEVVDRMLAPPGNKTYGALSVQVQARADTAFVLAVPPAAFHPPPKVQSTVIRLIPRPSPEAGRAGMARLDRVVKASFSQRRKTLANSLGALVGKEVVQELIAEFGWSASIRGETLNRHEFVQLADALMDRGVLEA
jgi:16S rRNA (adenine1518-N6/adenine1519-N6)-dimethyltransferase